MGNVQNAPSFYRHFSFEAFNHFLSPQLLDKLKQKRGPNHRTRSLGLEGFLWLGLFVSAYTACPNLQQIFNLGSQLHQTLMPLSFVSVSAFCQYRAAFSLKIYLYLWRGLLHRFADFSRSRNSLDTWRGLKLYALDTTLLKLPESLWPHFGSLDSHGPGPAQAFLMVLYNLTWRVPTAFRATKSLVSGSAQYLFKHFLHYLKKGDLLLIDQGFYGLQTFCLLLKQGVHFLIPMRLNGQPKLIKRFTQHDGLYQIKSSRYWKNNSLIPDSLIVRIITYQMPGFRPRRLVTSLLDHQNYPAEEIIRIYHQRWQIETFFREFKYTLQATNWHASTLSAFRSELLFQMLLVIITRLAMAEAAVKAGISPQRLSFGQCFAEVKRALAIIPFLPISAWVRIYHELLQRLKYHLIDIRPGRKFERDTRKRRLLSRGRYLRKIKSKEKGNVA